MKTPDFSRLLKVLWRETPDMVPFYEHNVDGRFRDAMLGEEGNATTKKAKLQREIKFFTKMGYDYVPIELGMRLFRLNTQVSTRAEPFGVTSRGWVDDNRSTIANKEEFDEYPWPEPEDAIDYEYLELAGELLPSGMKLVSGVAGGVHEHVMWLVGMRPLSIALRREPGFVDLMFKKVGKLIEEIDKAIADMDHVGALRMGDDMGFKSGTLLNPKTLREQVFPVQQRVVNVAKRAGKPFILHSCGNLGEVMEDLIETVGIDALHSYQDIIMPASEAKERYGDRIAILGGVDLDVLARGTVDQVKTYTKALMEKCMPGGGWALGSGNSIPTYVKPENYLAMLETGKKHGKYP